MNRRKFIGAVCACGAFWGEFLAEHIAAIDAIG